MATKRSQFHRNVERNRWETRISYIDELGQKKRRKITARTQPDLKRRIEDFNSRLANGLATVSENPTVEEYLDQWLDRLEQRGKPGPKTIEGYRQCSKNYIVPALGTIKLRRLTPANVELMTARMNDGDLCMPNGKKSPKSKRTQQYAVVTLGAALKVAERDGVVSRNVARLAESITLDDRQEGRTLSIEQAGQLLRSLEEEPFEAAWVVALTLGLRLGELLGLTWSNVDLDGVRLTVERTVKRLDGRGLVLGTPKTKGSKRTVVLPATVVSVLRRHRANQNRDRLAFGRGWESEPLGADLVFRTSIGTAVDPRNFRAATYRVTEAAGLGRWSPHELRHSAASIMLAQGLSIEMIADTLGHSSTRITQDVYAHLMDSARVEAATAMEAALWG